MNSNLFTEIESNVRAAQATVLREAAAELQLKASDYLRQADELAPLYNKQHLPGAGAPAPKATRKPRKPPQTRVTAQGIEPTLGQVADALKSAGKTRIGELAASGGFDRAKTLVLVKKLVADGKAVAEGKSYRWLNTDEPVIEPGETSHEAQRPDGLDDEPTTISGGSFDTMGAQ